ncbi:hypothetical protein [Caballeronia sordidicola]|uniref:hypothetical protein n=1 Tax=Caballeronia sordidicola TaxID=196367 RepID=UPI0012FE542A|nr:hypothetical protein [Caballeronia sordidicola]
MSIKKTYCCRRRMNVNFVCQRRACLDVHPCAFCKGYFRYLAFFCGGFVRMLGSAIQQQVSRTSSVNRGIAMKRVFSVFAAVVLLAAASAVNAVETSNSQPATCQGPASQCNVFFGH